MPGSAGELCSISNSVPVAGSITVPDGDRVVVPFHQYLLKIASRCNLNCSYCYVYNRVDQRWRVQPHFMSERTARQATRRIREHLLGHDKKDAAIVFHGGEPLLGGLDHLRMLLRVVVEEVREYGIKCTVGMQSNGLLFTPEIGDLMLEYDMRMGVSLDGPPKWNDIFRIDHLGRPTGLLLEERLNLLLSEKYKNLFSGILCVINTDSDPVEIFDYFQSLGVEKIDFLLPLDNHERLPKGKEIRGASPYGDWLIKVFDRWWTQGGVSDIRIFLTMMKLIIGLPSGVESLGLTPVDLVVVETNGAIEGVDSLKTTFEGATEIGLNVFQNSFDEAAKHQAIRARQSGIDQLCSKCKECPVVRVCGGGYYPHRYSRDAGFDNPSVYCEDLEKLIRHIHAVMNKDISYVIHQRKAS